MAYGTMHAESSVQIEGKRTAMAGPDKHAAEQGRAQGSDNAASLSPNALLEQAYRARQNGDLGESATALDAVLKAVPDHPLPLALRARVALERCEIDALARFDAALRVDSGNPELHLGKAQALELAGDTKGARIVAQQIASQAPGFVAALEYLSTLYLSAGESDFTAPFSAAAQKAPQDPNILAAWVNALAGLDHFEAAANVAARAREAFPGEAHFALLEALNAGSAGDWARAEAIYDALPLQSLQRWLGEARHRLRAGDIAAAQTQLDHALKAWPHDVAAWALQGLVWRLSDGAEAKEKAQWLHEQAGLVALVPLAADDEILARARTRLRDLHENAGQPLSQSLRGGSQTRGTLFHRPDPELAQLHSAIRATLETYRQGWPQNDPAHPTLRARDAQWGLAGSWSVRLHGAGDHHAAHIHPSGIISSALYITLPPSMKDKDARVSGEDPMAGWLELGRPPADLNLGLEPLQTLRPIEGHLALFPSTLYHATRPLLGGARGEERMSVAFDVITK